MAQMSFEGRFRRFVGTELPLEVTDGHLNRDKASEISYMKTHTYRFKTIFSAIPGSAQRLSVLDIGTTPFTLFLKKTYPHYEISTLDLTDLMQERCQLSGVRFETCDLATEAIPFEHNHFDVVVFSEVLEHLFARPSEIFAKIAQVMAPSGLLIFTVPNFAQLGRRLKLLLGIQPLPCPEEQVRKEAMHGHRHLREYTMKECVEILEGCGFALRRKAYISPPPILRWGDNSPIPLFYRTVCALVPSFRVVIYVEALLSGSLLKHHEQ